MSSERVTVACQQVAPMVGRQPENDALASAAISQALAGGADVIVLPELVTSGYVFASMEEARAAAITRDSPVFGRWAGLLAGTEAVVVGGFPELGPDDVLFNSVAAVDRTGVIAVYRKCHLWDEEKNWFTAGDRIPPVIDTAHGRLGLLVCYDLEFPEMARSLALRGAELIAVPTNWPRSPRPDGERPPEVIDATSMARLNRLFIACCDRVGAERGVEWTGGSCIIDVDGWILSERPNRDEGLVIADIDISRARD